MLKSIMYRIVSISALIRKINGDISLKLFSRPVDDNFDERSILEAFLTGIGERRPQIVGFASSMFDLPTIFQRAIINGVDATNFCRRPAKPWEPEPDYFSKENDWNVDLMHVIGHYGKGTPKLAEIALACGIPAKIGADGAGVADMWLAGKRREIVDYNECDVLSTYLVWLHTVRTCGLLDNLQVMEEHAKLLELLNAGADTKPHLKIFRDRWIELQGGFIAVPAPVETVAEQPAVTQPEPRQVESVGEFADRIDGDLEKMVPEVFNQAPAEEPTPTNPNVARSLGEVVSGKQLGMIYGISRDLCVEWDEECKHVMKCKVDELTKRAASEFIRHLQAMQQGVPA